MEEDKHKEIIEIQMGPRDLGRLKEGHLLEAGSKGLIKFGLNTASHQESHYEALVIPSLAMVRLTTGLTCRQSSWN